MPIFSIIFLVIIFYQTIQTIRYVKQDHRAVIFRLGRFFKVVEKGIFLKIPMIDQVEFIDLNKELPGWRGYTPNQLESKLRETSNLKNSSTKNAFARVYDILSTGIPEMVKFSNWLINEVSQQTGYDLSKDDGAKRQIIERIPNTISELKEKGIVEMNIPFIATNTNEQKHFNITIDKQKFQEIIK